MKIDSQYDKKTGKILFKNFIVIQKNKNFFGIYDMYGSFITHGTTLNKACKKAKLLEIGYEIGFDFGKDLYFE